MATKYWELEEPTVLRTEKNEIRVFKEHGKIQVYPVVKSAARGIGKGATIDLEGMTTGDLLDLQVIINQAIQEQMVIEEEESA